MQFDITAFTSELLSYILVVCLVFWAMARVLEVWLNVYDRTKDKEGS